MQNIEQNHHITEDTWIALSNDTIAPGDYMKILEHTCSCTWCAECLASVMEKEQAEEPPVYLKEQILERANQLDVQVQMSVKKTVGKTSKQLRLFMYSLKVGLAVVVSVFLLVISSYIQELGIDGLPNSWEQADQQQYPKELEAKEQANWEPGEKEGLLIQMNQFSQSVTSRMNSFSSFLLNGKD